MNDRWVRNGNVGLRVVDWHSGESALGEPPLLLLHGMSSNALFWGRVAVHLPERRLVAPDLRGHGRSDRPPGGYTAESMAADVAAVVEGLGLDRPVVVGHSWGAAVALELAAARPGLVSRLAIVDGPTASLSRRMSFEEADREMRPPAECYSSPEEVDAAQAHSSRDAWGDDLRPFSQASFQRTAHGWCPVLPEEGRAEMVRSLYALQPERLLAEVEAPTLIVMASDSSDGVAPLALGWWRSQAEEAASSCRRGVARRYASRHDIPLIRPAELAAEIAGTRVA